MGFTGNLEISYVWEGDFLSLWRSGAHANGGGYTVTTNTILTGFYAEPDERDCVGFELFDAAVMLLPYLNQEVSEGTLYHGELSASYCKETDTLALVSNEEPAVSDQGVADSLTAHCNEQGRAIGFTLENAAKLLLPYLETWRPWTAEELAEIQERAAQHEAAIRERAAYRS